ncbi:MAG: hypothetical protein V4625_06525 [Pseudomonadota bacterium]
MDDKELTPQQRLTASRKAIVRYMNQDESPEHGDTGENVQPDGLEGYGDVSTGKGTWASIKHTARVWWQHHPAQLALNLAKPALGRYAEEKPLQLLGVAAGIGAAVVVLRPWRLMSVTGLLFAAIKASDMPVLLMSLLSHHDTTPATGEQQ